MKKIVFLAFTLFLSVLPSTAQDKSQDVFTPITKYIEKGDYDKLSAWFAENLELDILGAINNCTRTQAKLIMKNFFTSYTPKDFTIIHKSGASAMKYAVGTLSAGGEKFRIILYVKNNDEGRSHVQQLKIERE